MADSATLDRYSEELFNALRTRSSVEPLTECDQPLLQLHHARRMATRPTRASVLEQTSLRPLMDEYRERIKPASPHIVSKWFDTHLDTLRKDSIAN